VTALFAALVPTAAVKAAELAADCAALVVFAANASEAVARLSAAVDASFAAVEAAVDAAKASAVNALALAILPALA
jgi:hypothetical protein